MNFKTYIQQAHSEVRFHEDHTEVTIAAIKAILVSLSNEENIDKEKIKKKINELEN